MALYAGLVSLSPRVLDAGDTLPFISFGNQELPDGRILSQARFETVPVLATALGFALALAAYGLLRRHWRHAGLETFAPDRRIPTVTGTLKLALVINILFLLRQVIAPTPVRAIATYSPVLGGVLELIMLYRVWDAVLESRRTQRSLRREPVLWLSLVLSLVPPAVAFGRMLVGLDP